MTTSGGPRLKPVLDSVPARGVWNGRRILRLVVVLAGMLLGAGLVLRVLLSGPDALTVLGLMVTFSAVVPTWAGLREPEALHVVARALARKVGVQQSRVLADLLPDGAGGQAADVGLRSPAPIHEPLLVRWRCGEGGPATAALTDIDVFFDLVPDHRMVILGNAGSGKTVLAAVFVRDRIGRILDDPGTDRFVVPVPVDLASWEPSDEDERGGTASADRLDRCLVDHLVARFRLDPTDAAHLVEGGWILPVLDGLDELDPADHTGSHRPRAAALLRVLNCPRMRPVVLVSRLGDYTQLAARLVLTPDEPVLRQARHVVVTPVSPRQAGVFLMSRVERDSHLDARCALLRDALIPGSDLFRPHLARAVADPTLLALLADVCRSNDPARLLSMSREEIGDHLLNALVPSVTGRRPCRLGGRPAQPEQVLRWLAGLAEPLPAAGRHRWALDEIHLDALWPTVGWHLPRFVAAALAAVPFLVLGGAVLTVCAGTLPTTGLLACGTVFAGGLGLAVRAQLSTRVEPLKSLAPPRLRSVGGIATLGAPALVGLVVAMVAEPVTRWALAGPAGPTLATVPVELLGPSAGAAFRSGLPAVFAFPYRAVIGVALGLAVGLDIAATRVGSAHRPSGALRRGMPFDLSLRMLTGVGLGVGGGLTIAVIRPFGHDPAPSWALAVVGGLAGVTTALATSRWLRYSVTALLGRGRRLPLRPARFLDWGHRTGLFRFSGAASQFRSTEFRRWLQRSVRAGRIR